MSQTPEKQGFVKWARGETWYEVYLGDRKGSNQATIVVVHGGPGMTHHYLLNLAALSSDRPIVFYDQIGNGRSRPIGETAADSISLSSMVDELEALIDEVVGAAGYILLAHSAGGCIAMEHALRKPERLRALILANCFPSSALMQAGLRDRAAELPRQLADPLLSGSREDPNYGIAMGEFFARYICRVDPPPELLQTMQALAAFPQTQHKLMGADLFNWEGPLAHWSVLERLSDVGAPTMVLAGAHDETGPQCSNHLARELRHCQSRVFASSSHVPHIEEPRAFIDEVQAFLRLLA